MPLRSRLLSFWRTLTGGARLDADLDDELRAHVDLLADEKERAGLSPSEARRAALLEVGGVEQVKEQVRDVRVGIWLDTVWQDVRYAARTLRKSPGFTAIAVGSLTLGIGLNAAIFSAVQAVLLQSLPYHAPDRIVAVNLIYKDGGEGGVPPAAYLEWQRSSRVFEAMAAYELFDSKAVLRDRQATESIDVLRVSASFLQVLGRQPALGRAFAASDDVPGSNVAILSDQLWRRRWQADPGVVNRAITIDNVPYRVIGIMPPGFGFYHQGGYASISNTTEVWLSDPFAHYSPSNRILDSLGAIGRLRLGVTAAQASAEMTALTLAMRQQQGLPDIVSGVAVVLLQEQLAQQSRKMLFISSALAALVLLIAALNLAALSLARTDSRQSELGLRAAVGASRTRLIRQLLTESAVLAFAGGALGVMLVAWSGSLLKALLPGAGTMPRVGEAGLTWHVLLFTAGATLTAALIFGMMPAWWGSKEGRQALGNGQRTTDGRGAARLRHTLIVLQLSLSLMVVAAAVLLVATAWREQHVPLGFAPEHLLTMNVQYPRAAPYVRALGVRSSIGPTGGADQSPWQDRTPHYALTPYAVSLPTRIADRLALVPGVHAAAVASSMPMLRSMGSAFRVEGRPLPPEEAVATECAVTPEYFKTLGLRVIRGRNLTELDAPGAPRVLVVNSTLARTFLGGESNAVGRRIVLNPAAGTFVTYDVVGVVSDARFWLREEIGPQMYTSFSQAVEPAYTDGVMRWRLDYWIAVRTQDDAATTVAAIVRALSETDRGAPPEHVEFMTSVLARGSDNSRGLLVLLMGSAGTALFLAATGVFGVTAFGVSQRTREIGIRVALGASPRHVMAQVFGGAFILTLAGSLLGSMGAYWTNRVLTAELYQVSPTDPRVFAAAVAVLGCVVFLACWLPARRAAAVDPVVALRAE
ncbi:MAG: ABC transporter permease [Vicinamibacteria bacterium]|nr:ABC transporter permease [Vicinamibacteria bacterium]